MSELFKPIITEIHRLQIVLLRKATFKALYILFHDLYSSFTKRTSLTCLILCRMQLLSAHHYIYTNFPYAKLQYSDKFSEILVLSSLWACAKFHGRAFLYLCQVLKCGYLTSETWLRKGQGCCNVSVTSRYRGVTT
jgi:hypothetical protein